MCYVYLLVANKHLIIISWPIFVAYLSPLHLECSVMYTRQFLRGRNKARGRKLEDEAKARQQI